MRYLKTRTKKIMLIGNSAARQQVKQLIQNSSVHSLILSGPRDVGKKKLALLAVEWSLGRPLAKNELDLLVTEFAESGKTQIGKQAVRQIVKHLSRRPVQGKKNYIVLEQADLLTKEAANSLLVSLEEPRGESLFILTTSNLSGVLPTIQSRSSVVRMGRVSDAELVKGLKGQTDKITGQLLRQIVEISHGLPERGIALIKNKRLRNKMLQIDSDIKRWSQADVNERLSIASNYSKDRMLALEFIDQMSYLDTPGVKKNILTAVRRLNNNVAAKTVLDELSVV